MNGYNFPYGKYINRFFLTSPSIWMWVGSGDSSRRSVPKIMASYLPPPRENRKGLPTKFNMYVKVTYSNMQKWDGGERVISIVSTRHASMTYNYRLFRVKIPISHGYVPDVSELTTQQEYRIAGNFRLVLIFAISRIVYGITKIKTAIIYSNKNDILILMMFDIE